MRVAVTRFWDVNTVSHQSSGCCVKPSHNFLDGSSQKSKNDGGEILLHRFLANLREMSDDLKGVLRALLVGFFLFPRNTPERCLLG